MDRPEDRHEELLRAFRRRVRENAAAQLAREEAESSELRRRVVPRVSRAVADARAEGRCGRAWLFGSFAWGAPTERSDVDLLVEDCAEPDGLAGRIWKECGLPVHVVQLDRAPRSLRERVLTDGELL